MPPDGEASGLNSAAPNLNGYKPARIVRVGGMQHAAQARNGNSPKHSAQAQNGNSPKHAAQMNLNSILGGNQGGCGKLGGMKLELCGFDPRRLPRPAEAPQDLLFMKGGQPVSEPPSRESGVVSSFLQINGQAKTVCQPAVSSDSPPPGSDLKVEDWSSSEDEGKDPISDSEREAFHYRKYRYQESQARARTAPPEPPRRRVRRGAGVVVVGNDGGGCSTPWVGDNEDLAPPLRFDGCGISQSSTPRCEEERPDDEQLRRMAEAVARFYKLPGEVQHAVKFKQKLCNAVVVDESAWAKRERSSQHEEPVMLWIRGGRVYDFHGDRGTLEEFEHDFLTRQVEDDDICRQRRREQGLMPFPFVAMPLKQNQDTEEQADGKEIPKKRH